MHLQDILEESARHAYFKILADAGVVGAKVDFFDQVYGDSDAYGSVMAYEAVLRDAARAKLMINFHGAGKPTGLEQTFPNEMTREGIRGRNMSIATVP